ncbi:hypothetical protein F4775DRAFT_560933 [Biscogniauxia sp. FL1348]|nr:hypothetical protein F4775DRAFT_560933 [Biscogniauxia sp. FL1348]
MASHNVKPADTAESSESCPLRHPPPPAYMKADQDRPTLEIRKYKARELLNCTVGSFFEVPEEEQPLMQHEAKKKFLKRFDSYMKLTESELHAKNLKRILKGFMTQMDEYFFFGSLTKGAHPIVELQVCESKDYPGLLGQCDYEEDTGGAPRCLVTVVRQKQEGKLRSLPALIISTLHEMVHAYVHTFVCNLPRCERNRLNTKGVEDSQHGPTFRALAYATMVCVSQWRLALREYLRTRMFKKFVERVPYAQEQLQLGDEKAFGKLDQCLPLVKAPSHHQLIRIRMDKVLIDSARLRAHVKKYAAKPKDRALGLSRPADRKKETESVEQHDNKPKDNSSSTSESDKPGDKDHSAQSPGSLKKEKKKEEDDNNNKAKQTGKEGNNNEAKLA